MEKRPVKESRTINARDARDFVKGSRAFVREATKSPEAARKVLVDLGIYTPTGKLTKRYK